jgi:hypothetical protein
VRYLEDPRQTRLFDVFANILSPTAYQKLRGGWPHLFRSAILKRTPAEKLADHFHPEMGRPTKELYSIAGLLFIMEFRDWTHEEAVSAYMFHVDVQYAPFHPPPLHPPRSLQRQLSRRSRCSFSQYHTPMITRNCELPLLGFTDSKPESRNCIDRN